MKRERRSSRKEEKPEAAVAEGTTQKKQQRSQTFLSVGEIVEDTLTALSLEHWADDAPDRTFSKELVDKIYREVLLGDNVARIQLLETSRYLEA